MARALPWALMLCPFGACVRSNVWDNASPERAITDSEPKAHALQGWDEGFL
jgi:hypothetical protein